MSEFGLFLLGTLLRGAVLFGVALLLECCFRHRLAGARARLLWWGMLVVMLFPFGQVSMRLSEVIVPLNRAGIAAVPVVPESVAIPTADLVPQPAVIPPVAVSVESERWQLPAPEEAAAWFAGGVMVGAGIVAILLLIRLLWWQRRLAGCRIITEWRLLELMAEARRISGTEGRPITLRDGGNCLKIPACCGVWRPSILFPAANHRQWSDRDILMLLVHELIHLRRNDQIWTLAFSCGGVLFWFNPFFHFFRKKLFRTWEAECDAAVVRLLELDREGRVGYARLLLDFSLRANCRNWIPGPALSEDGRELKQRMTEVLTDRKIPYRRVILAGTLLALIAGILTPVFVQASEKKTELHKQVVPALIAAYGEEEIVSSASDGPAELKSAQEFLDETRKLIREKQYDKALKRCRWFFYHIERLQWGMHYAFYKHNLKVWAELAELYAPAKRKLEEIRDRSEAYLRSEKNGKRLLHNKSAGTAGDGRTQFAESESRLSPHEYSREDVMIFEYAAVINHYLKTPERTCMFFRELAKQDRFFASLCWDYAEDDVIDCGDWELAARYIGNGLEQFRRHKTQWLKQLKAGYWGDGEYGKAGRRRVLKQVKTAADRYIRYAKAVGEAESALRMEKERDEVIALGERLLKEVPEQEPRLPEKENPGKAIALRVESPLEAAHGEEVKKSALYKPPELKIKNWTGYISLTVKLVRQKKYQEALNRYRWFFYHILDYDQGYSGVRISFAMAEWAKLGKLYPAARAELEAIRDRSEAYLRSGKARLVLPVLNSDGSVRDWNKQLPGEGEWQLFFTSMQGDVPIFGDLEALNRCLGTPERSLELFRFLDVRRRALAHKCWKDIEDEVIDNGNFELVKRYIPDLNAAFENHRALLANSLKKETRSEEESEARQRRLRLLRKMGKDKLDRYIKVARAWGMTDDAERMEHERDALLRE